MKENRKLSLKI